MTEGRLPMQRSGATALLAVFGQFQADHAASNQIGGTPWREASARTHGVLHRQVLRLGHALQRPHCGKGRIEGRQLIT